MLILSNIILSTILSMLYFVLSYVCTISYYPMYTIFRTILCMLYFVLSYLCSISYYPMYALFRTIICMHYFVLSYACSISYYPMYALFRTILCINFTWLSYRTCGVSASERQEVCGLWSGTEGDWGRDRSCYWKQQGHLQRSYQPEGLFSTW